jgi:succinate dehydrogenase / fumarate reductase membrane anchor subunit
MDMVTNVTSFGRSGLYDWMIQRVTAVVLLAYTLFIVGFLLLTPDLDFNQWESLFKNLAMRIFTLMLVFSFAAHAWIGLWCVTTDYIPMTGLRVVVQCSTGVLTFVYVAWAIQVIWGL